VVSSVGGDESIGVRNPAAKVLHRSKIRESFDPRLSLKKALGASHETLDAWEIAGLRTVTRDARPLGHPDVALERVVEVVHVILERLAVAAVPVQGDKVNIATRARREEVLQPGFS